MSEATEKYDGLNLPQLLDLMHGIVEPTPVSWMPQTDGWWVLLGWLLVVCALGFVKWLARRRLNRYRRISLKSLAEIEVEAPEAAAEIAAILKRTALAAFPRNEVASLTGPDWAEFLSRTAAGDTRVTDSAPAIARAAYHDDVRAAEIVEPAKRWVKLHRA